MGKHWGVGLYLFSVIFFVAMVKTCLGAGNMTVGCFAEERLALLKLKQSCTYYYNLHSSWVGSDCCRWFGVRCDGVTGHVVSLRVTGILFCSFVEVNSTLAELTHLNCLDLSENDFQSSHIPEFIGSLKQLRYLNLSFAHFSGIVPHHLGNLSNLNVLDLSFNSGLMANDMAWVSGLSSLKHLDLSGVDVGQAQNLDMVFYKIPSLVELHLSYCHLEGSISESLGRLTSLRELNLWGNKLRGPMPEFIGNLTALEILDLRSNELTGAIPTSIGRLFSLQEFHVSSNLLNGTIPVSIGQLTKLVVLDISNNSFEGVVFETHFANLSMLKYLDARSNLNLTFNISHEWIPPFQLTTILIASCKIASGFPGWFRTQTKLKVVVLSNVGFSGHLPTWLRKMPIVPSLDLSDNQLRGPLTNLPCGNLLHGFGYKSLVLKNNLFNGSIPKSLCRWTHFELLDLSENRFSGKIPRCLENLQQLRFLTLSSNGLSGVIPSYFFNMSSSMLWLKLNNNNFRGELPVAMGNCFNLIVLDLGDNDLSGSIPNWIGDNLTYLVVLRLRKNNFIGRIPRSLCRNSKLQILDIAHNSITGGIPRCFKELSGMIRGISGDLDEIIRFGLTVVQVLKGVDLKYTTTLAIVYNMDLSSNKLVGEIPDELTILCNLVGLNLSHNHLTGGIPDSIGNMKLLISLDFSHNELTGVIPPSMAALTFLSQLNLSHNNLSGRIPTGNQLQVLNDPSIYVGNRELCGAPLPKNCSNHERPTTNVKGKDKGGDEPKKIWFYLDVMSGFATGFWGVIGVLIFKKQWRHALFRFGEATMNKIHVAIAVRVAKMKRGGEAK